MTALRIPDVRLVHTNFAGKAGPYNNEGRRNFGCYIDNAKMAANLASGGLRVNAYPMQLGWYLPVNIDTEDYEIEIKDPDGLLRSESWWTQLDEYNVRGDVFVALRSWTAIVHGKEESGVLAMLLAIDIKKMERKTEDATS